MPRQLAILGVLVTWVLVVAPVAVAGVERTADDDPVELSDELQAHVNRVLKRPAATPVTEADLAGLTSLNMSGDEDLDDLSGLEHATGLVWLWLSETSVSDLAPISGLTSLEGLSFSDTSVTSIESLSGLSSLWHLVFDNVDVSDLGPLGELDELIEVWVRRSGGGAPITDLSPLIGLEAFEYVDLRGSTVSKMMVNQIATLSAAGVSVWHDFVPPDTHGDTAADATSVAAPSETDGVLIPGDVDYLSVTLAQKGELTASTTGDTDTSGVLEDADGNALVSDDDTGEGDNFSLVR